MLRRNFIQLGSLFIPGSLLLETPKVYSFVGGWKELWLDDVKNGDSKFIRRRVRGTNYELFFDGPRSNQEHWLLNGVEDFEMKKRCSIFYGKAADERLARILCRFVRAHA